MYSKNVLRTCTDRLYVHAWNLWGLKLQKIYSQGMSRFTARVLDHKVGCWPFQGREISKTQRMNIFPKAGRLPLRSIMTTGTKWGGVLLLCAPRRCWFSPHSAFRITKDTDDLNMVLNSFGFFQLVVDFLKLMLPSRGEADRWAGWKWRTCAWRNAKQNKLPTVQGDSK